MKVFVGLPPRPSAAAEDLAARLERGLASAGVAAGRIPAMDGEPWGSRWEAIERFLEERAPCLVVSLDDPGFGAVAARLSRRIRLVAFVGDDFDAAIERSAWFGEWCEAVVAASEPIHLKLASRWPSLAPRTVTIRPDAGPDEWLGLFERIDGLVRRGGFVRRRAAYGWPPPAAAGAIDAGGDRSKLAAELAYLGEGLRWPDTPVVASPPASATVPGGASLEQHRVLVATTTGVISGVDVFAAHLVRGLRARGIDARLHGRRPAGDVDLPADLAFEARPAELDADFLGWPQRWRLMAEHLAGFAPCLYVPNYDVDFSCIAPMLPPGVRVVGIGHSDDPWHYEHLGRIGHACDALVGVSRAITEHLGRINPSFGPRLATIPYGVPIPESRRAEIAARRERPRDAPLRIAFTGRLVRRQKRALDLIAIARALEARGVAFELAIIGDGELRPAMERAAARLVFDRKVWFTGAQPNDRVLEFLGGCDAFLLPSLFEGLSVGMLEAMSCGAVPVVSDIRSGVPDLIVDGENGLIAPVGDIEAFASRLETLARDPDLRHRMAEAAHRTVAEGFGVDRMVERYVEVFRRAIAEPLARPRGPVAPPPHLGSERGWANWVRRVASDPAASLRRVAARLTHPTR